MANEIQQSTPITTNHFSSSLKRSGWISVIESLLTVVIGILIIIEPDWTLKITSYLIGGILSVRGLFLIVNYFIEKGYNNFFNNNLLSGVVSLLVGLIFLFTGQNLLSFFRLALGAIIIYCALSRINLSIKLHSASIKNWFIPLILSLVSLILGSFLLFNENSAILLAGWFLIISGLFNTISDIFYIQDISRLADFFDKK